MSEILTVVVSVLIVALIEVPLFRIGSRILALRKFTFGATYMLALITSASLLISNIIASRVITLHFMSVQLFVSVTLSVILSGWVVGYLYTNADRKSIGILKGSLMVIIVNFSLAFGFLGLHKLWLT